jgi:hypothetical protein
VARSVTPVSCPCSACCSSVYVGMCAWIWRRGLPNATRIHPGGLLARRCHAPSGSSGAIAVSSPLSRYCDCCACTWTSHPSHCGGGYVCWDLESQRVVNPCLAGAARAGVMVETVSRRCLARSILSAAAAMCTWTGSRRRPWDVCLAGVAWASAVAGCRCLGGVLLTFLAPRRWQVVLGLQVGESGQCLDSW